MEEFEIWGENPDPLVQEAYRKNNYKVVDIPKGTNVCYIFFSSNGIYYPNTKLEFEEKIIIQDRFEWESLPGSKKIESFCDRQIFVRDIYNQWYICGINEKINTIDKLLELLYELTKGYEIVTVGISSGGYIVALAAAKLNAKKCFNFSGQVSLWNEVKGNIFLEHKSKEDIYTKWYNIKDIIESSNCHFYYFYASGCEQDFESWKMIKDCSNVFGFGFPWKKHAATCFIWNMPYVLTKSDQEMEGLAEHYMGKKVNPLIFSLRTMPFPKAVYYPVRKLWKIFLMKRKS